MDLVGIPLNPVPAGAVSGTFASFDGILLRYARWSPEVKSRNGTVCLFGGRTEFIEKYFETISDLRRRGFAVATMDWRGQGGSARPLGNRLKGHVDDFILYDRDLVSFMREVVLPDCPPPYFALAHSMGGNVLLRAACEKDCWFERMVLTAPMLKLVRVPVPPGAAAGILEAAVFLGLGELYVPGAGGGDTGVDAPYEGNLLTSDAGRYARNCAILRAAPALGLGAPTIGWLRAAYDSMQRMRHYAFPETVHTPLLMLAAGKDQIVSSTAIEELGMRLKAGKDILIAGSRHEILQETDARRGQFWAAFDAFIPGG